MLNMMKYFNIIYFGRFFYATIGFKKKADIRIKTYGYC